MKNLMILFCSFVLLSLTSAAQAQAILSYTAESDQDGFAATYTLYEKDVDNLYLVYKEIKDKDTAMDATVREGIKMGLVKLFKKDPVAMSKRLKTMRLASPATLILISMVQEKDGGSEKEQQVSDATLALLQEILQE